VSNTYSGSITRFRPALVLPRSINLVEPQGAHLHPIQTIYLRLTDAECNIPVVTEKLQQQLESKENIIICDSKGVEISDSAGTTGNVHVCFI